MNLSNNQTLAINAIDSYSGFSKNQKQILKTMVHFEHEIPADNILNVTGLSRQAFHFSMKMLLQEEYVTRKKVKVYIFQINKIKLLNIIETFNIQSSLTKDNLQ